MWLRIDVAARWLSSVTLVIPNLSLAAGLSNTALVTSSGITYHGVRFLCGEDEQVVVAFLTHGIVAVGLMAWVQLLVLIMPI
jgi:hypothetical protein